MICPECGSYESVTGTRIYCGRGCGHYWDLIDPAELLELIEKAEARGTWRWTLTRAIKSYLSGDPKPLKKLGGE
jgi:hypothetical protein